MKSETECMRQLASELTEDAREELRHDSSEHEIRVGDGRVPALAVAHGTRVSSRRLWADDEKTPPEEEPGPSASRHGVDVQLRRLDRHAGDGGFEHVVVAAGVAGHVGGRSAHVEADDLERPAALPGGGHRVPDHATGGALRFTGEGCGCRRAVVWRGREALGNGVGRRQRRPTDRIARWPLKDRVSVRPPSDCMKDTGSFEIPSSKPLCVNDMSRGWARSVTPAT